MVDRKKAIEDLFYAAVIGDVEMLKVAITEGDVNESDDDGSTPLMLAAVNGQKSAVEFLLKNGADPSRKDIDGWNASTLANNAGHKEIAEMIDNYQKENAEVKDYAEELEEIAIVAFVQQKGQEIKDKLKRLRDSGGRDEKLIKEVNHLMLLLFAEVNAFYENLDEDMTSAVNGTLEYLNEDFSKISAELGRDVDHATVDSIKNYDLSLLLDEDEKFLKDLTKKIYNAIVTFASEELNIAPSDFSVKYEDYRKRLLNMREALLESLREIGEEKYEGTEKKVSIVNMIGNLFPEKALP